MSSPADLNGDGIVSENEILITERKVQTQRKIAVVALGSMIIFTLLLFSPIVPIERVTALSDLFGLFYITMGSLVGTYMGVAVWLTKGK
jgi:hypothetical protein